MRGKGVDVLKGGALYHEVNEGDYEDKELTMRPKIKRGYVCQCEISQGRGDRVWAGV